MEVSDREKRRRVSSCTSTNSSSCQTPKIRRKGSISEESLESDSEDFNVDLVAGGQYSTNTMAHQQQPQVGLDLSAQLIVALKNPAVIQALSDTLTESVTKSIEKTFSPRIDAMEKRIDALEASLSEKDETIRFLQNNINDQNQYSRRNMVRITGVLEEGTEDTDEIVLGIAKKIKFPVTINDIDRSHRVGDDSPRAIVCKFTSYRVRKSFITKRKALKNCQPPNAPLIYINEQQYERFQPQNKNINPGKNVKGQVARPKEHHQGPISQEYITDPVKRAQVLYNRLPTLIRKARELYAMTHTEFLFGFKTELGRRFKEQSDACDISVADLVDGEGVPKVGNEQPTQIDAGETAPVADEPVEPVEPVAEEEVEPVAENPIQDDRDAGVSFPSPPPKRRRMIDMEEEVQAGLRRSARQGKTKGTGKGSGKSTGKGKSSQTTAGTSAAGGRGGDRCRICGKLYATNTQTTEVWVGCEHSNCNYWSHSACNGYMCKKENALNDVKYICPAHRHLHLHKYLK